MNTQDIQRALMGLSPEYQQKFYDARDKFFNETDFTHTLPDHFDHFRFFIGCHLNEISLRISAETFNTLFYSKSIARYSVGNMVSICEGSEKVTLFMYKQSFGDQSNADTMNMWRYMRVSFESLTGQVNAIVEPEMEKLLKGLARQQAALAGLSHAINNGGPKTFKLPQ